VSGDGLNSGSRSADLGPGVVVALLGPTGVGKTAVALELARLLGSRIISCDSMQLYRGFPVLTNQPSLDETERVPHALVACVEPDERFTVAAYASLARPLVREDVARQGWALVVGGTGLYMRAALAPLAVAPEGDPDVRARLEARAAAEGPGALHADLARLDPAAARSIDPGNIRRLVRALEVVALSGEAWSGRHDLWNPVYDHPTVLVGLVTSQEELYRRINTRVEGMMRGGAVEEVGLFLERDPGEAAAPGGGIRSAIGYPEICRYLEGRQTLEETIAQVAGATRRYARRQLTWLRKLGDAVIIDVRDRAPEEVAPEILELGLSKGCARGRRRP